MKIVDDLDPRLTEQDYERTVEQFVAYFASQPWSLSIATFGAPAEPGISDIDTLVIVEDGSLSKAHRSFSNWTAQQSLRSYLFTHPPVILTPALVPHAPHLHTLNNLKWENDVCGLSFRARESELAYLNLVWATSFIPTSARLIRAKSSQSLRFLLLILKNLHTSQANMRSMIWPSKAGHDASPETDKSRELRISLLDKGLSVEARAEVIAQVIDEFRQALPKLLLLLDSYGEAQSVDIPRSRRKFVRLTADTLLSRQEHSAFCGLSSSIAINSKIFDLVFAPWESHEMDVCSAPYTYKYHVKEAFKIFRREAKRYEFVLPFSYPIYLNRTLRQLRKLKQSLDLVLK